MTGKTVGANQLYLDVVIEYEFSTPPTWSPSARAIPTWSVHRRTPGIRRRRCVRGVDRYLRARRITQQARSPYAGHPHQDPRRALQHSDLVDHHPDALLPRRSYDGVAGVFDFERLLESAPGSPTLDPRYANADWLHHFRSADALKASQVVGVGVRPLFG